MSNLDDKLREIMLNARKVGLSDETATYEVAQIKQAFEEAGYVKSGYANFKSLKVPDEPLDTLQVKHEPSLMTGQEWYDRFEKELSHEIYGDTNPSDKVDCEGIPYACSCDLLDAAKRAAGLDDAKS